MATLYIATALVLFISGVHSRTLCSRIFFQNIDENKMPYKFIEGVFIKQISNYNNFPVYKRENDNLLFYLYKYANGESLDFGLKLDGYFGVGARTKTSAVSWLATGTLDKNDVFGGLVSYWIYYNRRDSYNYKVPVPPNIKAICVDNDFRECNSEKVYLNSNFTDGNTKKIVNDMNVDYFHPTNYFRNLRPVYIHSRRSWYLQYTSDNYWLVTTSRFATNRFDRGALMRVNDYALRPEFINNIWSIHYKSWTTKPDLKVRCRGVRSQANICSTNPCSNRATCIYTSGNETLCACRPGYYGPQCKKSNKCPTPQAESGEIGFAYPGNIPGYIAMTFCRSSYPSLRYAICTDGYSSPYWSRQGTKCRDVLTTERPYPTTQWSPWRPTWLKPTPSPINFDDMPDLSIAILVCAILLQILLPFILWCCAICRKACKENDEEEEDQQRRHEFEGHLVSRLENVRRAQSQDELDQGVQEYQRSVQEYQQETEATEMKRKKGFYRNASFFRLYSMDFYFSFYLWLIYILVCTATQCTQYGSICNQLNTMAIVMVILCPLFVLLESYFSHELSYIRNIMEDDTAWGYIQKLQAVAPVISMTVECYHWETRTRVVYYTDANGNSQSRTETYQERVVTYVDCDEFQYGCWVDVSKREMPALSYVALTRLKIDPHILFGDQETEDDFDRQRQEMLERNRHRDVFMDFSSSKSIPGLKKRISAYVDMSVKPWWISQGFFWLATLLNLTWPYRWLFRAKTAKSYYDLKKKMYKSTSPPPEVDIMDPVAILQQTSIPVAARQSNVNHSFAMSELPSDVGQAAPPPYPGTAYPPITGTPACTAANQLPYHSTNKGGPYPPTNQGTPYPIANQGTPYPIANQGTPYLQANQGASIPSADQGMPNIPPPAYESAVGPTGNSASAPPYPVA